MSNSGPFENFWSRYCDEPLSVRQSYFDSLPKTEQNELLKSFYKDGWYDLFVQNYIDKTLDHIKTKFHVDVIDMRIKAIKQNKVFLVDKDVWDYIERSLHTFDKFNSFTIFGGLVVSSWGRNKQFYRIRANHS